MTRNIDRPISRQALGRTAFIGWLYDATTDEFCERPVVNDDIPEVAIRHMDENHGHSSYEFDSGVSKKLRKLNVDASLSLSILGGLVKSAGASYNYIYTHEKTTQQIEATFVHRTITRTESLNVSHKEFKSRIEPTALRHKYATHVVTSIRWGADVFAQFEAKSSTAESKHIAKAGLKLELNKLLSKFISVNPNSSIAAPVDTVKPSSSAATEPAGSNTAAPAVIENGTTAPQFSFDSSSTATAFNYKITLFGDMVPTSCPRSIEELIAMLPSIAAGLKKENGGKGRPLEYIMLPLTELADVLGQELNSHRIFRAVEEHISHEIQSIFDDYSELRTIVHTLVVLIGKAKDFFPDEEIDEVSAREKSLDLVTRDAKDRIGKMLVRVRSGNAEPSELDQLLIEIEAQLAAQKTQIRQLERGDINVKIKYALELKDNGVIAIREPETRAIIQNRNPKHKLLILYTNNELRTSLPDQWVPIYFDFLEQITESQTIKGRYLFLYFDYDLNPNFKPQHKKLEVQLYVGPPKNHRSHHVRAEAVDVSPTTIGIDSLFKTTGAVGTQLAAHWYQDTKKQLDDAFGKFATQILLPYTPALTSRHRVFETLRNNQKNILLIGRSSVGKSTLKNILVDPTWVPNIVRKHSSTQFPEFDQYSPKGSATILNFIDTPGLFQQADTSAKLLDNTVIMQLIDSYVRSKATQLHFVCFCISMDSKVHAQDLYAVKAFLDFLGPQVQKNACLIITRSESKNDEQLERISREVETDLDLKGLSSLMKQGIFFSGSINPEDWMETSDFVHKQFKHVCRFREKLLKHFIDTDVKPFSLSSTTLGRKIREEICAAKKEQN